MTLFYLFNTSLFVSAYMVLRSKNPVHSVFYLVLTFMAAAGLLMLLGLEFFALLQLLVYVGALAVMFLFVVMLLDISATEIVAHQRGTYPVAGLLLVSLIVVLFGVLYQPDELSSMTTPLLLDPKISTTLAYENYWNDFTTDGSSHSQSMLANLGVMLYGVHVDLLILASLLLLVAMMGAVALTLKRRATAPLHDVFVQHSVDFTKVVAKIDAKSFVFWFSL